MKGFDSRFDNFPNKPGNHTRDSEEKKVDTLNDYYSNDIPVRSPSSLVIGNKAVIKATLDTLSEFPDRQLLGEDVIWSGSPERGMLSSLNIFDSNSPW